MKHFLCLMTAVVFVFANVCFNVEVAEGALSHLRWTFRLDEPAYLTLYMVTLNQCHRECYVRTQCKGISYHRIQRACVLTGSVDSTATELKRPGWLNSVKRNWTNKSPAVDCANCNNVCAITDGVGSISCNVIECGRPSVTDIDRFMQGNMYAVGSKVKYVCTDDTDIHTTSECLSTGQWSFGQLTCTIAIECTKLPSVKSGTFLTPNGILEGAIGYAVCTTITDILINTIATCESSAQWSITNFACSAPKECKTLPTVDRGTFLTPNGILEGATGNAVCTTTTDILINTIATCESTAEWSITHFVCSPLGEFNGQIKRIVNPFVNKYWHNHGWSDKKISVRYQPDDAFCNFEFIYMADDGSYKLRNNNQFICDGYQHDMAVLNSQSFCQSEERLRYFLNFDSSTSTYLFRAKGTDRYVRVDEDMFISTIHNLTDKRARFKIMPI